MIVDVNNLDLDALKCYLFYAASTIAQSYVYGIQCNVEELHGRICEISKWLWIAEHCPSQITEQVFCNIQDCIDWVTHNWLYIAQENAPCDETEGISCGLTITEYADSCSEITINIL